MNNTTEVIHNMLQNSDIASHLPIIGEISIKDVPGYNTIFAEAAVGALLTGIVTIFSTYIGSKFGSKKTLELFEKEERIKVREKLRREFYFEYEELYVIMCEELNKLIGMINDTRSILFFIENKYGYYDYQNFYDDINISNINGINDIKEQLQELNIEDIENQSIKLDKCINDLEVFMDLKDNITKYKEFKYSALQEIIDEIHHSISSIDSIISHHEYALNTYIPECLKEDLTVDIDEKSIDEYINSICSIVNQLLRSLLLEQNKTIEIHKEIRNEFIGDYFK